MPDLTRAIERAIAGVTIEALLSAGWTITVNDGEEDVESATKSTDKQAILDAMWSTDGDYFVCHKESQGRDRMIMWVWGNGIDCLSDYSVSLEEVLKPVNEFVDKIDRGEVFITSEGGAS